MTFPRERTFKRLPRLAAATMPARAVRVAPATLDDLDRLLALEALCYSPEQAYSRGEYRYALSVETTLNLKVESSGSLVGFAGAFLHARWRTANVYTVNVHPRERRRGIGRALLVALEGEAAARGMRRCILEVNVDNAPAIALYERCGYERVERLRNYYESYPNPDAWRYERSLD